MERSVLLFGRLPLYARLRETLSPTVKVLVASCVDDAIAQATAQSVDVMVIDMAMPGEAEQIGRELRARAPGTHLVIVARSESDRMRRRCALIGADATVLGKAKLLGRVLNATRYLLGDEQRRSFRVRYEAPVTLTLDEGTLVETMSVNLGESGLLVAARGLAIGARGMLTLALPRGSTLRARFLAIRSHGDGEVAVTIDPLDAPSRARYEHFLYDTIARQGAAPQRHLKVRVRRPDGRDVGFFDIVDYRGGTLTLTPRGGFALPYARGDDVEVSLLAKSRSDHLRGRIFDAPSANRQLRIALVDAPAQLPDPAPRGPAPSDPRR